MRYCVKCGGALESEELKFCPHCGAPVQTNSSMPPSTPSSASTGMEDNIAGLLCYILGFVTGIIFLVLEPYNKKPFVRFHAFQSIFFSVALIVISIALSILSGIFYFISWTLGIIFSFVWALFGLVIFVVWIFLMFKAYSNEKFKLPIIGQLAENQATR